MLSVHDGTGGKMMGDLKFVVADRYGYLDVVEARDSFEATRIASNFSEEANLDYATTRCVGLYLAWRNPSISPQESEGFTLEEI